MRKLLVGLLILIQFQVLANMANPVWEGTLGSRPFVSQYVDVLHEDLRIVVDQHFEFAQFEVKYHIDAARSGQQIPFLFYASEFLDSFSVRIDGREVRVQETPYSLKVPEGTKFKDFSYFFERLSDTGPSSVLLEDSPSGGFYVSLNNMIYFEANIPAGKHTIEVSYRASQWTDTWSWVKEYSFRYALSPALYWRSFGSLKVELDARAFDPPLNSNLGEPSSGSTDSIAIWSFDSMPVEVLQINYHPEISDTAQKLIDFGPERLALITGILMALIHLLLLIWYRKKHVSKRFSLVVIVGSLLIPVAFVACWINYYELIDSYIGEQASSRHGYAYMLVVLLPILIPAYWLVYWLIDYLLKKYLSQRNE